MLQRIRKLSDKYLSGTPWYTLGWAVIILILSVIPMGDLPIIQGPLFEPDKLVHTIFYVTLTYFAANWLLANDSNYHLKAWIIFFVSASYGIFIEVIQYFLPYRGFEIGDILADVLGVIIGGGIYYILRKRAMQKI